MVKVDRVSIKAVGEFGSEFWYQACAKYGIQIPAASLQRPPPEFSGLPTTALGVPLFFDMTLSQKEDFIKLCGIEFSNNS